jgi:DNA-directed RNA polymerase subunit omega
LTILRAHPGRSVLLFNIMQSHLLEEAQKVITNPQILVNVISRRVRQLTQGHRPLIEVASVHMGTCDIALTEVIQGKLSYEMIPDPNAKVVVPAITKIPAAVKSIAA